MSKRRVCTSEHVKDSLSRRVLTLHLVVVYVPYAYTLLLFVYICMCLYTAAGVPRGDVSGPEAAAGSA